MRPCPSPSLVMSISSFFLSLFKRLSLFFLWDQEISLSTRLVSAFTAFQHLRFGHGTHAIVAHNKRVCHLLFLAIRLTFPMNSISIYCLWVPQTSLFSNFFIKNGFHYTIYIFKNYFTTVLLVSVFNFSKNKFNSNEPLICISLSALGLVVQGLISTSKSVVLTDQWFNASSISTHYIRIFNLKNSLRLFTF